MLGLKLRAGQYPCPGSVDRLTDDKQPPWREKDVKKKKKKGNHETMQHLGDADEEEAFSAWMDLGKSQLGFEA